MYYSHFGLKEPPYKITPNTDFFFSGGNRGAVLDALVYAITNGEGIVKVVGEVGSGKTMLCRVLQSILPERIESIYLANPSVAPEDVLHAIAFELQLKLPKNADRLKVMQLLQAHLLARHAEGHQVVIFVEEAQGMPLATLEEIRLLSNLETKQDKLLQIVLFGQPELDVNLNQTHIRQLRERITHSFNLTPLQTKDIGEYLLFRLRVAGYYGPQIFSDVAIKKLSKAAEGLIRRVNILADKALLAAFADNVYLVTPKHVAAAIQDSEFGIKTVAAYKKPLFWVIFCVFVAMLAFTWLLVFRPDIHLQKTYLENTHDVKPTVKPTVKPPELSSIAKSPQTADAVNPIIQSVQTAPVKSVDSSTSVVTSDKTGQKDFKPIESPKSEQSLVDKRLEYTKNWLFSSPSNTITIQVKSLPVMNTAQESELKTELEKISAVLPLDEIYLYRKEKNGETLTVVLYGAFTDRKTALKALKKLPKQFKSNHPYLRTILSINKDIQ